MNLTGSPGRHSGFRVFSAGSLGALAVMAFSASQPARAGDWSVESRISEKGDFNDNFGMDPVSEGVVFGSITDVYGDFIYLTHDSRFDLIGDIVARKYWGPGDSGIIDGFRPTFETKYHKSGKLTSFDFGAKYAEQDVSSNDALDISSGTASTTKRVYSANFGIGRTLGRRDTLYFANSAVRTVFDGDGTDNLSLDSSLSWTRRLTKRLDRKFTAGVNHLSLEDLPNTEKYVYRARVDFTADVSKRLEVHAGGGVNLVNIHKTDLGRPRDSSFDLGYLADAGFAYQLKTTRISGSATYGLNQGTLGDLQNQANASLSVSEQINDRTTLALTATAQMFSAAGATGTGGAKTYGFNISPTYKVLLTDEWDLLAGYKWSLKDSDLGTARSNDVFLQLTRNFTALP